MAFISAIGTLFRGLQSLLKTRTDTANVGDTAAYPRVQIHSVVENQPLDKDMSVRRLELIVESISNKGYDEAVTLNEANLQLLIDATPTLDNQNLRVIGIVPDQLTELNESADSENELYRQLQRVVVFVEKVSAAETTESE